jgi:hypothetical protein
MKLLSVEQARAAWMFPLVDMNPLGKYLLPVAVAIAGRYKFGAVPNVIDAIKKKEGLIFGQGSFAHPRHGDISLDIAIYNDAIFADTRTDTDASEAFLADLLLWMDKEYGLKYPENARKTYISRVYVHTPKKLSSLNPKLEKFAKSVTGKIKSFGQVSYEFAGISFYSEQVSPLIPHPFRFERADNIPFSEGRYYSYAAMQTGDHLAMLNELEELLG